MAEPSANFIPGSWENIVQAYLQDRFGDPFVVKRRMPVPTDPNFFIGVFCRNRNGDGQAIGQRAPAIQVYNWDAWVMIKHANEEEGRDKLNDASTLLWRTLAGANSLVTQLTAASDQVGGGIERYSKHNVLTQETFDPVKANGWYHHSRMTFTIETEIC